MSTYQLVPEPEAYVAVSGLGSYVAQQEPEAYVAVSGLGQEAEQKSDYLPGATVIREKESMTGMWILLALAGGSAAYMYWRLRQAGIPLSPAKAPVADLGHSGRTYYGVFPKHRGYGHHRLSTGRFHFHPRRTW